MVLKITVPVNTGKESGDSDPDNHVRSTKIALNHLGYFTPRADRGIDDDADEDFNDALYAFQRIATIGLDDTEIGPGTATDRLITEQLKDQDPDETYVWYSVGDDHVRGSHAARNGKTFFWNAPPEGGPPGEDHNCRCWATPTNPRQHPWIDWARARQEDRQLLETPYLHTINTAALVFEGTVISVELCLRNGRCRTWLMQQAAKYILNSEPFQPPTTLPGFPNTKRAKPTGGRARWTDPKGRIYEWDSQHGEVEIYDKTGKKHLGAFDPKTGNKIKAGKPNRKIKK